MLAVATNERLAAIHNKGNAVLAGDSEWLPPFLAALVNQAGLTPKEAISLSTEQSARLVSLAASISNVDQLLPVDQVQLVLSIRGLYSEPLARLWYENVKGTPNPGTVRYIDNLLAQPG